MDATAAKWFSDPVMGSWEMGIMDDLSGPSIWEQSFSPESHESYSSLKALASTNTNNFSNSSNEGSLAECGSTHKKALKTESWSSCITEKKSATAATTPSPSILSFKNPSSQRNFTNLYASTIASVVKQNKEVATTLHSSKRSFHTMKEDEHKSSNTVSMPTSAHQDHVMAERKRREKLNQRFIALSSIVPGLKKMDKASVLGDAVKYVKQLQEKVRVLEDTTESRTIESAVLVNKSQVSVDDDGSSFDENFIGFPQIEVKLYEKSVLVRIQCDNHKGLLAKVLLEIENLHLTIVSSSVIPFICSSLDMTVVAKMDEGFSMTVKEIAKKLNSAFRQFIGKSNEL